MKARATRNGGKFRHDIEMRRPARLLRHSVRGGVEATVQCPRMEYGLTVPGGAVREGRVTACGGPACLTLTTPVDLPAGQQGTSARIIARSGEPDAGR